MSIENFKLMSQNTTYILTCNDTPCCIETYLHESKELPYRITINSYLTDKEKKKIKQEITKYFNNLKK
jgi:hypothetical protein